MPDGLKKAAAWLGLVPDDRYTQVEEPYAEGAEELTEEVYVGEEVQPTTGGASAVTPVKRWQQPSVQPVAQAPAEPAPVAPQQQTTTADLSRIITVHPRTYNEARTIGEHFRDDVPVIMNLTDMEDVDAKRLVDFAAGLVFGLRGTIERVTSKVFLLSPHNVSVAAEDKERIAGSFFNQS